MARPKHYDKIGVEIEGGWTRRPNGLTIKYDGSVHVTGARLVGEAVSEPGKIPEVTKWMDHVYPHHTNRTCGLHVHMSLNRLDYARLMEPEFYAFFLAAMKEWGETNNIKDEEFWNRLRGENRYCQAHFYPNYQLYRVGQLNRDEEGTRYTHLNFCCYKTHGTVECRMFPTFKDKKVAISAVEAFVDTVHRYLRTCGKPKAFRKTVRIPRRKSGVIEETSTLNL